MALPDPVLDATRAEVTAYGLRRATMTSIARRAGISRATLYRRAASLDALVQDALVADFEQMLERAFPSAEGITRAGIVTAARSMLAQLAENSFTQGLLAHDPELLLPYLVDRLGRSQDILLAALEAALAAAQEEGEVREGNPRILALGAMQALTPYVISLRVLEAAASRETWFDEAARLLDAYLRPDEETRP